MTLYTIRKGGRTLGRTRSFREAIRLATAARTSLKPSEGHGRVTIDEVVKPGGKR